MNLEPNEFGLLTADQVAEGLNTSRRHVVDVLKDEIGYLRTGKKIMFIKEDVDAFIKKRRVRPVDLERSKHS